MYQEEIKLSYGEGRYLINMLAVVTADGISITVTGGEKPHVGAMAMCVPSLSANDNKVSVDTWITPRSGHKDDQVAAMLARQVCMETRQTTAVVAGIHIDQAQASEIEQLLDNSKHAAKLICTKINEIVENKSCIRTSEALLIN